MQKAQGIFKVGLCQIKTIADKQLNLVRAEEMIRVNISIIKCHRKLHPTVPT